MPDVSRSGLVAARIERFSAFALCRPLLPFAAPCCAEGQEKGNIPDKGSPHASRRWSLAKDSPFEPMPARRWATTVLAGSVLSNSRCLICNGAQRGDGWRTLPNAPLVCTIPRPRQLRHSQGVAWTDGLARWLLARCRFQWQSLLSSFHYKQPRLPEDRTANTCWQGRYSLATPTAYVLSCPCRRRGWNRAHHSSEQSGR